MHLKNALILYEWDVCCFTLDREYIRILLFVKRYTIKNIHSGVRPTCHFIATTDKKFIWKKILLIHREKQSDFENVTSCKNNCSICAGMHMLNKILLAIEKRKINLYSYNDYPIYSFVCQKNFVCDILGTRVTGSPSLIWNI